MPLDIKNNITAGLGAELASRPGLMKQASMEAEPRQIGTEAPLRDRLASFWQHHPMPPKTGQSADKIFFDELSGGL